MAVIEAGMRCAVNGRTGVVTEVFNGEAVAVLFDDDRARVMVVELSDPTLSFEGDSLTWLDAAMRLPAVASQGRTDGYDEWRGEGDEQYLVSYDGTGHVISVQRVGQFEVRYAPEQ